MRRVAVTGLGAVTPLGHDARSTWEAAVAGRSGVDWIRAFDPTGYPVRIASEVKDFDPVAVVGPKDARRLERNVVLAVEAAREAWADAGVDGVDPARAGILVGSAIGGVIGVLEQNGVLARARPRSGVAVVPAERARRLGERADRDRPRPARPELRTGVRLCDRLALGRRGGGAHSSRRRRRRARGRDRGVHAPRDPRGVLRDAGSRRGRGGSDASVPAVRRDARRLRDGGGRVRAPARGLRPCAGARRADLRGGARVRHLERRAPHGPARPGVGRGRGDDARGDRASRHRAGARRLHQRARDVDAAGRPGRDEGDQGGLRRRTPTSSPSPRRSRCSGTCSGPRERSRR